MNQGSDAKLEERLRDAINRHGHAFQDAIYRQITTPSIPGHTWEPWVPEFPVGNDQHNTRIDLILTNPMKNIYLVCECKRVNPSLADWCFSKSAFTPRMDGLDVSNDVYAETFGRVEVHQRTVLRARISPFTADAKIYHRGLEVKGQEKGENSSVGRGQIEEAATQVCKGLNGLANFFAQHLGIFSAQKFISIIPVIITTANLWSTIADSSRIDIKTGNYPAGAIQLRAEPWLWFHYPQSDQLKHSIPMQYEPSNISQILYRNYIRPIAIVNSASIGHFLGSTLWNFFNHENNA